MTGLLERTVHWLWRLHNRRWRCEHCMNDWRAEARQIWAQHQRTSSSATGKFVPDRGPRGA